MKDIDEPCRFILYVTLQRKSHLCIPFLGIARLQSQFPHSCVCERFRFIYSQDRSTYFPAALTGRLNWKYLNLSQIYECRNWETEHYNSVLEISRLHSSFLGIHRWQPDIYIGFSPPFICSVVLTHVNSITRVGIFAGHLFPTVYTVYVYSTLYTLCKGGYEVLGLRQINTCRKVPFKGQLWDMSIMTTFCIAFCESYIFLSLT